MSTKTFTGNGSFTVPAGVTEIFVVTENLTNTQSFSTLGVGYTNSHVIALKSSGEAWTWGNTGFGHIPVATLIAGGHSFTKVVMGRNHSLGLKSDGSVWSWGSNSAGQLGNNTVVNSNSPISVIGGHSFINIAAGQTHSLAVKSNGEVWSWGGNIIGQLGDNTVIPKSSPVSVIGSGIPNSFTYVSACLASSQAIASDGIVWCWGQSNNGQLGDGGNTIDKSSPVSVIGAHSFIKTGGGQQGVLALKADGSVWSWGSGSSGQLGNNTVGAPSSPVSAIGAHSFIDIARGDSHALALKANGEVWSWGGNLNGQLGDNTLISKSSPVSVVGGHSFTGVGSGAFFSFALKANGEVWSWGANNVGQLSNLSVTEFKFPISQFLFMSDVPKTYKVVPGETVDITLSGDYYTLKFQNSSSNSGPAVKLHIMWVS
jgi:alpha-tubulin suppressor-like RCC1 family protein